MNTNITVNTNTTYLLLAFLDKKVNLLKDKFELSNKELEDLFITREFKLKNTMKENNLAIKYLLNIYEK